MGLAHAKYGPGQPSSVDSIDAAIEAESPAIVSCVQPAFPAAADGQRTVVELLGTYLNDHLAGSTGGLELARRALGSNKGNAFGEFLDGLVLELEQERHDLATLIEELGFRKDRFKVAAGWLGEKVGRAKPNGSLLSYSPLSRLIELEGLTTGVAGKRSMWVNLQAAGLKPRTADLPALEAQANSQLERLEIFRKRAAAEAFGDAR